MIKISPYNENSYEQSIIELFQNLGYTHYYGPNIERDYKNPLFKLDLENLYQINKSLDKTAVDKAIETIQDFAIASLEDINDKFMTYLQNGISVNYWKDGKELSTLVKLIDFDSLNSNFTFKHDKNDSRLDCQDEKWINILVKNSYLSFFEQNFPLIFH